MTTLQRSSLLTGLTLFALMVLTRGSHMGTVFSLPDATIAVMMLGGMLFRRGRWFTLAMAVCVAVDAYAIGIGGISSYCLSPAYWSLLPTYAMVWFGGAWLAEHDKGFRPVPYFAVGALLASLAFVLSTQSFYLFSGRYPNVTLWEALHHGWEYYPSYVGYTMMYLGVAWVVQRVAGLLSMAQQGRST